MKLSEATQILLTIFLLFLVPARAQDRGPQQPAPLEVPAIPISEPPMPISYFGSAPPDVTLVPHGDGARNGHLWIRTADDGLYIAGKLEGEQPDFAHAKSQILRKDHIEVWLSGTPEVDLPDMGWGNQFEDETLPNGEKSCAAWAKQEASASAGGNPEEKCRAWAIAQKSYRPYFKRLFLRQWLMTPDYGIESFATPAFDEIERRFSGLGDRVPGMMKPKGKLQMFLFPSPTGYSFEIFIPVEAFPPLPSLSPGELYLLVDVFNAAPAGKKEGVYSTSSAARVYGKAETFNLLRLDVPFHFSLTPCDLPLVGSDKRGAAHPAWFIPSGRRGMQDESFLVLNDPGGYRYEPAGLSPTVRSTRYFWRSAGANGWVCGPDLTYKKGSKSESFPYSVSEDGFDTKLLPDGHLLIKTGPRVGYSEFGSGQCGACPTTDLRIFDLTTGLKLNQVLALGNTISAPALLSQDFAVSPDWSRITEYDLKEGGSWSSTTWCLRINSQKDNPDAYVYEKCVSKENVQPPDPPILKELRNTED